ncbi:signal peptidase II [Mycolicibacterium hodleri]|uniref:signal peptidase II n=1 Tax=Mycolicibacterium hodleri TaxID=49897 RepID=UPI0013755A11|nr:signal peptidase II [Mycolicibacterium hodleri]
MSIVILALLIVVSDWLTKEFAVRKLAGRRGSLRLVTAGRPVLRRPKSPPGLVVWWVLGVACAITALACAPALREDWLLTAGVAAALAGAAGNLADGLIRGAVVDFVAIGHWPAFNLADVAIVGGAAVAGLSLL